MATQSECEKGGYKRRLTKSVRDSRSPIRTRSRSRSLAREELSSFEQVPNSSSTALEYSLKRKYPHRLEPLPQNKKSKTKGKYLDSTFQRDENKQNDLTEGTEFISSDKDTSHFYKSNSARLNFSNLGHLQVSENRNHSEVSEGAHSHATLALNLPNCEENEICLVLGKDICKNSCLDSDKTAPFATYTRLPKLEKQTSSIVSAPTSEKGQQNKNRQFNFHRTDLSSNKDDAIQSTLAENEQALIQDNIQIEQNVKTLSLKYRSACKRKQLVSSHPKLSQSSVVDAEQELSSVKSTKDSSCISKKVSKEGTVILNKGHQIPEETLFALLLATQDSPKEKTVKSSVQNKTSETTPSCSHQTKKAENWVVRGQDKPCNTKISGSYTGSSSKKVSKEETVILNKEHQIPEERLYSYLLATQDSPKEETVKSSVQNKTTEITPSCSHQTKKAEDWVVRGETKSCHIKTTGSNAGVRTDTVFDKDITPEERAFLALFPPKEETFKISLQDKSTEVSPSCSHQFKKAEDLAIGFQSKASNTKNTGSCTSSRLRTDQDLIPEEKAFLAFKSSVQDKFTEANPSCSHQSKEEEEDDDLEIIYESNSNTKNTGSSSRTRTDTDLDQNITPEEKAFLALFPPEEATQSPPQSKKSEDLAISFQSKPSNTKNTGSCTSSRSRRSSRIIKLPSSSSTGTSGGTSRTLGIRTRGGMSGTDTGQELSSNLFASEGSSASENAGNIPALLEARGLPPHLFGALGPRMQHLLHRSMGSSASNRAHQLLQGLQAAGDEGQQLQAVMEMCQLLVMGNEDTLTGFPVKQVVPVLITLLSMEHNFDMMNHACRALTYMMEALPRSSAVVVEAVPAFLEKLQIIQCMDVAEQSLTALEMLSRRHTKAILHAKGIAACLMYLDFFSINAQRAALAVTANCCQSLLADEFNFVRDSLPLLSARLCQHDKKSVESVCVAFARLVECFQNDPKYLIDIAAHGLLSNIQQLLAVSPPIISSAVFVTVVRMLAVMCATCPELAVVLLKQNITDTLKYLLLGTKSNTDNIELIPRSPQELFEITSLIGELMPRLPTEGIFAIDHLLIKQNNNQPDTIIWQWRDDRGLWHPYTNIDIKIIEAAQQSGEDEISLSAMGKTYTLDFSTMTQINEDSGTSRPIQRRVNNSSGVILGSSLNVDISDCRIDCLQTNSDLAAICIKSLFSVLYEVYSSSAGPAVRHKCLRALLRMIYFSPLDLLQQVLRSQTVASNVAAMLASQDLRVVVAALQMAEILMQKLPEIFGIYFRREGVVHQVRCLSKLEVAIETHSGNKDSANSRAESVPSLSLIPALIPMGSQSGLINCDSNHSSFSSSILPVSSSDLSDNAINCSGGGTGLWSSSSCVATTFEAVQSPSTSSAIDECHVTNPSQSKISDVLKRKRTVKRSNASSRKARTEEVSRESFNCSSIRSLGRGVIDNHINPILGSSMITLSACASSCHNSAQNASPVLNNLTSTTASSSNSSTSNSGRGKLSSAAAKTSSFFANLNPARWGRWSSSSSVAGRISAQDPCLLQKSVYTNSAGNKEKIKTWIKEQAQKFDEEYFSIEYSSFSYPAINILNRLTAALAYLDDMNANGLKALTEIRNIVIDSDISSFEVIHSGIVKKLLQFLTIPENGPPPFGNVPREDRLRVFLHVFAGTPIIPVSKFEDCKIDHIPITTLVTKLNACVSQLEQFAVKVHDLPGAGFTGNRGTSALKFFNTHQLKCNLQRHLSCTNLRQWRGGPVKIDPLALVQAIERYLVIRGYGRIKNHEEEGSDDDNSDDDIDDNMANMMINQGQGRHRLQFLVGENILPYNMTVYQAIRQYGANDTHSADGPDTDNDSENLMGYTNIWIQTHTIWYRPIPSEDPEATPKTASCSNKIAISPSSFSSLRTKIASPGSDSPKKKAEDIWNDGIVPDPISPLNCHLLSHLPESVTVQDASLEVICLLRVINAISNNWGFLYQMNSWTCAVPQSEFINSKLTAKANRQLQDPLAIMTGNVPSWLSQIAYACPFLFPFETRYLLFYVTSFDRDRALQRLLDMTPEMSSNDSTERVTPRLERRKRTVSRDDLLKQAEVVMQDLGSSKALLEIQYESEVGTGLGPTLEFYSLVSKELQRGDLDMWRGEKIVENSSKDQNVAYMFCSKGLFPMPLSKTAKHGVVIKVRSKFKLLGKFLAKALMDSRMLDIPLSLVFYKWMLNQENNLSLSDLKHIDESISHSILQLEELAVEKRRIENEKSQNQTSLKSALECLTLDGCSVEDLNLDFTLPGFPHIELRKGGKDILVTIHNLEDYLKLLQYWTLSEGVRRQMEAFKEGFESVFPLSQLKIFYPDELEYLFCGSSHSQWDIKSLAECCHPDHGYTLESRAIKYLFEILSSYNKDEQRQFLQFVTGSPRLPVGGLKSLSPPLTIVCKGLAASNDADSYLPSVMTCVNYLKLPDYSSIEIMREKLFVAVNEGQHSFHLS